MILRLHVTGDMRCWFAKIHVSVTSHAQLLAAGRALFCDDCVLTPECAVVSMLEMDILLCRWMPTATRPAFGTLALYLAKPIP